MNYNEKYNVAAEIATKMMSEEKANDKYDFDILNSIALILQKHYKKIALQFPEGLLSYACRLADIFSKTTNIEVVIIGESAFGACCIDDFTAKALKADALIHYGHSRLVPTDGCGIDVFYVPVKLTQNIESAVSMIAETMTPLVSDKEEIALFSTAQFLDILKDIRTTVNNGSYNFRILLPQISPLSEGEILGCTAPKISQRFAIYYGDGMFHPEAVLLANPQIRLFQLDPFLNKFSEKKDYSPQDVLEMRKNNIRKASSEKVKCVGIVLSVLGRQGNPRLMRHLMTILDQKRIRHIEVLLSDVSFEQLLSFKEVDVWVQLACPRLSVDWASSTAVPILSAQEAEYVFGKSDVQMPYYAMDNWADDGNVWSNYYRDKVERT